MTSIDIPRISVSAEQIRGFCQRWNIVEMALFGSVVRNDFTPESDIDVLVDFRQGTRYTLTHLVQMSDELAAIFGRPVDIVDRKAVEQSANYIRRKIILESAQVIYAE